MIWQEWLYYSNDNVKTLNVDGVGEKRRERGR